MFMRSFVDLWRGIRRHPLKIGGYIFTSFSVIFTIIKALTHFIPGIKIEGRGALMLVIAISVAVGLKKAWKPSLVTISIPNTNTDIEIVFGDLFKQPGVRVISVSEFFESKLGKPVSEKSLHGAFIQRCFAGYAESLDGQIDEQLKDVGSEVVQKSDGKTKSFPIGTAALIAVNQDRYLLFALAKAEPETCKTYSDVMMMWVALHKMWQRARTEAGGEDINVALIGSGLAGLGLPTRDILNLIILSVITETKSKQITRKIRVVLHRDRFNDLDLRDIKKHWEGK